MAADTEPLEILLHLPLLAEDKVTELPCKCYFPLFFFDMHFLFLPPFFCVNMHVSVAIAIITVVVVVIAYLL